MDILEYFQEKFKEPRLNQDQSVFKMEIGELLSMCPELS